MTPRELFDALVAVPRQAGTAGAEGARRLLESHLVSLGYDVKSEPFTFQPAAVNVLPILGAGLGWLTLLVLPALLSSLPAWLGPFTWFGGLSALGLIAWGIGTGVEIPGAERCTDANLIATRGAVPVRRWIVAHVDTKAQGHSMAGRLVAVWIMVLAVATLSGLVLARAALGAALPGMPVAAGAGLAIAAGVLAGRGKLVGASPGARDNGTGLLAALVAAGARPDDGVGFLFSGAEEFGLVGARSFARKLGRGDGVEVVNLDTLTGNGVLYLLAHDARGRDFASRLYRELAALAPVARIRTVPLGILVDSVPFARTGASAVTLSRLDWDDLKRIHTAQDTPAGLELETAQGIGAAIARLR